MEVETFTRNPHHVLFDDRLGYSSKVIYAAMVYHSRGDPLVSLSERHIAADLKVGGRQVISNSIDELIATKHLQIKGVKEKKNIYLVRSRIFGGPGYDQEDKAPHKKEMHEFREERYRDIRVSVKTERMLMALAESTGRTLEEVAEDAITQFYEKEIE